MTQIRQAGKNASGFAIQHFLQNKFHLKMRIQPEKELTDFISCDSFEITKNLILEIVAKLKGYDESASHKLKDAEDNIHKNAQDIASHSNLLREHTKNINTFVSTNATFKYIHKLWHNW